MKKIGTTLVFLACVAIMAGYVIRSRELRATNARLAAVQREAIEKSRQAEEALVQQAKAEEQRTNLLKLTAEMGAALQARQTAANTPAEAADNKEKNGFGSLVGKMMKDPQMRSLIEKQQRMMMDQLYAQLLRKLGMTPEEGDQFIDLVAGNAMRAAEKAGGIFGGSASGDRQDTLKALAEEQKRFDEDLRVYLGDKRYATYKEYNETLNERTQLNSFRQQFAGEHPITDEQSEQLLTVMREEKQNLAPEFGAISNSGQDAAKLQALLSDSQGDRLMQAQETLNARVYSRATDILGPEQLGAFSRFQTNQIETMRMGLAMARKMFGGGESGK